MAPPNPPVDAMEKDLQIDKAQMLKQAESAKKEAYHYMTSSVEEDHWELCREQNNTLVYKCQSPPDKTGQTTGHIFRAECTLETDIETLGYLMHPWGPYRLQWDKNLGYMEILDTVSPVS